MANMRGREKYLNNIPHRLVFFNPVRVLFRFLCLAVERMDVVSRNPGDMLSMIRERDGDRRNGEKTEGNRLQSMKIKEKCVKT